jgi:Tfp pilus assembly protein PilO
MKFKSLYLWFAAPVILIGIWVVAFYLPLTAQIQKIEKETVNVRQEGSRVDSQIALVLDMRKKDAVTRQLLAEISTRIPMFSTFPEFMLSIARSARKAGLSLDSFNAMPVAETGGRQVSLVTPVIEIGAKGRFLEIGRFIDNTAGTGAFKGISKASIMMAEKDYPLVTAKVAVEFRAWKEKDGEGK